MNDGQVGQVLRQVSGWLFEEISSGMYDGLREVLSGDDARNGSEHDHGANDRS